MTQWTAACQASLSFTVSQSLLKLMTTELVVMLSNQIILCCPLFLLPSIFPSIRVFSNELALCIRWPKYWRFRFSISSSSEYSEFISFGTDLFDLLAVQGTLRSVPQPHSSEASILWCSAFFILYLDPADFTLCSYTAVFKVLLYFNVVLVLSLTLSYHMTMLFYWMHDTQIICHFVKKAESQRIDTFELWCWRRLLRVPWTARRSNQSILKEIGPGCPLEGMMLKLKLPPPHAKS